MIPAELVLPRRERHRRNESMARDRISINRAPVLTLWAAIVAEHLGFDREEALSLGKAFAGLTAQSKGRRLGIFAPTPEALKKARKEKREKEFWIEILGRHVPANSEASKGLPSRKSSCGVTTLFQGLKGIVHGGSISASSLI